MASDSKPQAGKAESVASLPAAQPTASNQMEKNIPNLSLLNGHLARNAWLLCGLYSCCYFLKYLQGLERIIDTTALGRISENFVHPVVNRTTGLQNPLGQSGIIKFQNRVLVEDLPERGRGRTTGKTSGRHKAPQIGKESSE